MRISLTFLLLCLVSVANAQHHFKRWNRVNHDSLSFGLEVGQRFVMGPGDTVAIKDHSLMFSMNKITGEIKTNNVLVHFNWSNSETGKGHNNWYRPQSQLIQFDEKCSVVAYKIDPKNNQSSFISNC